MISFCCCSIKPHSYFLLVNYISSIVFGFALELLSLQMYYSDETPGFSALLAVLIIFTTAFLIINVIALFIYIFKDDIHSPYQRFYALYQISFTAVMLLLVSVFLIYNIFASETLEQSTLLITYCVAGIIFLSLQLFWSLRLKKVIYNEPDNEEEIEGEVDTNKNELVGEGEKTAKDIEN